MPDNQDKGKKPRRQSGRGRKESNSNPSDQPGKAPRAPKPGFRRSTKVNSKAFRELPRQKLAAPEVAQKKRSERQKALDANPPRAVVGLAAPVEGAPSIPELARALQNDVDLIYQFIHDNIDFYPTYGLHRGGWGALCDGIGNAFDLSDLMVQLLTEAGYTASYVTGYILLDASQWSNWLNVSTSDIALAAQLLGDGGFSGTYYTDTNEISIDYCWVQVSIDGVN